MHHDDMNRIPTARFWALCLGLGSASTLLAQMGLVDSLKNELRTTTDSTQRAELLIKIGDELFNLDLDSAVAYFDQAERYAPATGAQATRAKLVMRQGYVYDRKQDTVQTWVLLDSALKLAIATNDQVLVSEFHHWRGEISKERGRYDIALSEYYKGQAAAELAKDDKSLMISIHDLSLMLKIEGRKEEAGRMMRQASEIAQKLGDPEWIMDVEGHLGEDAQADGDLDGAIVHFTRALEFAKRRKDMGNITWNMDRIGVVLTEQGRLEEAMAWFQQVLDVNVKADPRWNILTQDHIGALRLVQGKAQEALHHYLLSHELYKEEPSPSEEFATHLRGLSKVYAALDWFEPAYESAARSHAIMD